MLSQTAISLLSEHAEFLRNVVPPERFAMFAWFSRLIKREERELLTDTDRRGMKGFHGGKYLNDHTTDPTVTYVTDTEGTISIRDCGTAGCSGGWACVNEHFNELGLCARGGTINYKNSAGWSALASFFDIDERDAATLFGTGHKGFQTPREVAQAIEQYIASDGTVLPRES